MELVYHHFEAPSRTVAELLAGGVDFGGFPAAWSFRAASIVLIWVVPKIRGTYLGVPWDEDYSVVGSILGSPYFWDEDYSVVGSILGSPYFWDPHISGMRIIALWDLYWDPHISGKYHSITPI